MNEIANMLVMFALGFGVGVIYGRMMGMNVEDELNMKLNDLTQQVRILKKRLDSE
ncbi:hypothetical protein ACOTET_26665 [Achromobacter xylosoxidans]